jgi:hypothetical protein
MADYKTNPNNPAKHFELFVEIAEKERDSGFDLVKEMREGRRTLEMRLCYGPVRDEMPGISLDDVIVKQARKVVELMAKKEGITFDEYIKKPCPKENKRRTSVNRVGISTGHYSEVFSLDPKADFNKPQFYVEYIDPPSGDAVIPPFPTNHFKGQDTAAKKYFHNSVKYLRKKGMQITTKEQGSR